MEDVILKRILRCKSASDGNAIVGMCEKDEELRLIVEKLQWFVHVIRSYTLVAYN